MYLAIRWPFVMTLAMMLYIMCQGRTPANFRNSQYNTCTSKQNLPHWMERELTDSASLKIIILTAFTVEVISDLKLCLGDVSEYSVHRYLLRSTRLAVQLSKTCLGNRWALETVVSWNGCLSCLVFPSRGSLQCNPFVLRTKYSGSTRSIIFLLLPWCSIFLEHGIGYLALPGCGRHNFVPYHICFVMIAHI